MDSDRAPSGPILDYEGALARLDGDRDLFAEMVGYLREDLPTLLNDLRHAVHSRDPATVRMKAHA